MQKRGRAVETQKLKRTMKSSRKTATLRESPTSYYWTPLLLIVGWMITTALDVVTGLRFELLWPCWTLFQNFYFSANRRSAFVTFGGQATTFVFICVTATSDLICYLFIPVRLLIFLASTYVWMNSVCHAHGGFLVTMKILTGDKSQGAAIIFMWILFLAFELICRMCCAYPFCTQYSSLQYFADLFGKDEACLHVQGVSGGVQQAFNAFFAAHCIGYPMILISFNAKYHYKEWRVRMQQGDVSDVNESMFRLLANAIPMDFDATRLYRRMDWDDECLDDDFLETTTPREVLAIEDRQPTTAATKYLDDRQYLTGEQMLLLLEQRQARALAAPKADKCDGGRQPNSGTSNTTPVASPAENGPSSSNGVVQRRHNGGARPSISSKSRPSGKHSHHQRPRKDEDDWLESSASECEVALSRRNDGTAGKIASTVGSALMAVVSYCARAMRLALSAVPLVKYLVAEGDDDEKRRREWEDQREQLRRSPHASPASAHPQPRRSAARANGSVSVEGGGGGGGGSRRRMAGENSSHANGRPSRSNGLGACHNDAADASVRDVSRESARTQHSEESGEQPAAATRYSNGTAAAAASGPRCGLECAKLASDIARLRAELRQARQTEEASRLAMTNATNGERNAHAEAARVQAEKALVEKKIVAIESQRDAERGRVAAADRKVAELAARAAELQNELQKERQERRQEREKGREKSETVTETQQRLRDKEADWEKQSERFRADARSKDETIAEQQAELVKLRPALKSVQEAEDLRNELALLREKTAHLEQNLVEENKLKQELFRALSNTQAERARARQYDYPSSSPSFYPMAHSPGGSNGTHAMPPSYASSELGAHPALSCATEQAFASAGKHSYSFASPSPAPSHSAFLSPATGQHTLFEPLPMPPAAGGHPKNLGGFALVREELNDDDSEPFYGQNLGKFGAPSPSSARTTTSL